MLCFEPEQHNNIIASCNCMETKYQDYCLYHTNPLHVYNLRCWYILLNHNFESTRSAAHSRAVRFSLSPQLMASAALSFVTVHFSRGVCLYLPWPPPHESRHLRSGNRAPRVNRQTGAARAGAGLDRRHIKLWHSHWASFPFSPWLTNRFQAWAPPPCLLLSTSGFPGPDRAATFSSPHLHPSSLSPCPTSTF